MDVLLALVLSCSVHYDDHLVQALAMKLSIGNQYFFGDLATLNTYDAADSVAAAHKFVDAIAAKGGRAAVGYMSVPIAWAPRFGRTTDELFDGCTNIGIATAMLSEYEHACTLRPARMSRSHRRSRRHRRPALAAARHCILRRLERDLAITGIVEHVLPDVAKLDGQHDDADEDPPPARAPVFPDNTDAARLHESADWSSQRLFPSSPPARSDHAAPLSSPTPPTAAPGRASKALSASVPSRSFR